MAKYKSRYLELAFYVNGVERKFSGGAYEAKTAEEVTVLNRLSDAEPDTEEPAQVDEVDAEDKPAKAPAKRKANAASSAK
ncbi:hypothetical protein [Paenibacillus sp. UASWS1643]|uniref:hypothetical protein n=1 Tax=Paenibacillus sp. UASWS1643 TaxID=2580422 RepID=UPI00123B0033|nr:hypothetical protein [Paenibacillus sp. UASWS1643]KAA8750144.1 hypothetical protein FE296_16240 [Paenibacillus sp. UASWS1643]